MTGSTCATDFPVVNAFQPTKSPPSGITCEEVFVTKLDPTGSTLIYSTYLGGHGRDGAWGITVDAAGSAYVTGSGSDGFPFTNALHPSCSSGGDAFVTKFNPEGSTLAYSTCLGGALGRGIAVDSTDSAYVTGQAGADFPTTVDAFQPMLSGTGLDAFVTFSNVKVLRE